MARTSQRWRQAVVWLHVLTSVSWMAFVLVLLTLLTASYTSDDPQLRISATSMAQLVDDRLLAVFGNSSAFTGLLLSAATAWGFFQSWWVLTKFAITVGQLNAGIFLLSDALHDAGRAAAAGLPTPGPALLTGTALMASALAFQTWLSVAKPWRRTPWAARKPATAPNRVFAAGVLAVPTDIALSVAVGFPAPLFEVVVLIVVLSARPRRLRRQPERARQVPATVS